MHYFLDTNVIIGNIFSLDPLNKHSILVFKENAKFYYSKHVEKECENKIETKLENYSDFFQDLIDCLEEHSSDFVDADALFRIVKSNNNHNFKEKEIKHIINTIFKEFNLYTIDAFDLKSILFELVYDFEEKHRLLFKDMFNCLKEIPNHKKSYPEIETVIYETIPNADDIFHESDRNILFDVHEYACRNNELGLVLVTWDKDFSNSVKDLLKYFCISNCCYITDFVNK